METIGTLENLAPGEKIYSADSWESDAIW